VADHDYKTGGLRKKYYIQKRVECTQCDGSGSVRSPQCNCRSVGECYHFNVKCPACDGYGATFRQVDPNAKYFVLRLDEDPNARVAALAYAQSVEPENAEFAADIRAEVARIDALLKEAGR
jgi:hypothetical protein